MSRYACTWACTMFKCLSFGLSFVLFDGVPNGPATTRFYRLGHGHAKFSIIFRFSFKQLRGTYRVQRVIFARY